MDRPRTRPPLSCRECFRRKIKCDKTVPCRPCIDRGHAASCYRRSPHRPAAPQPGAGASPDVMTALANLQRRVSKLEASADQCSTPPPDGEDRADFRENGLAGAIEEAALGIGEARRLKGAPGLVNRGPPHKNDNHWFNPVPLSTCLDLLPLRRESQALVEAFCKDLNWMCGCLHAPTLLRMHSEFWDSPGPRDGMLLSLLFAVLSISAFLLDDEQLESSGLEPERLRSSGSLWFDCSLATYFRCDALTRPSLMACQAMIALNYSFHLSGNTRIHDAITHLNNGSARALNLHLLGADCSGSVGEIVHREIARRVWWYLVETEWYFTAYHRYSGMLSVPYLPRCVFADPDAIPAIDPRQFNTAMPDLTDDGTYASSVTSGTHSLSFFLASCQSSRVLYDIYGSLEPGRSPSYDDVLVGSEKLERIQNHFLAESHQPDAQSWICMRRVLGMRLAYRSYLVHRSYFVKSLDDEAFHVSLSTCLSAANTILRLWDEGLPATFYRLWNITLYLISAGIVLALDLVSGGDKPEQERQSRHARLGALVDLLSTAADQSGIGARGAKLISHLCTVDRDASAGQGSRRILTREGILDLVYSCRPAGEHQQHGPSPAPEATWEFNSGSAEEQPAANPIFEADSGLDETMLLSSVWAGPTGGSAFMPFEANMPPAFERDEFLDVFADLFPTT